MIWLKSIGIGLAAVIVTIVFVFVAVAITIRIRSDTSVVAVDLVSYSRELWVRVVLLFAFVFGFLWEYQRTRHK